MKNIKVFVFVLVAFLLLGVITNVPKVYADPVDGGGDSCETLTRSLKYPMRDSNTGGEVSILQDFLSVDDYYTKDPNGIFNTATKKAVIAFQKAHNLTADGSVGPITRSNLNSLYGCGGTASTNPSISSLSSVSGPVGTNITILGTGFTSSDTTLYFGGYNMGVYPISGVALGSSSISFTVPASLYNHCTSGAVCNTTSLATPMGDADIWVSNSNGISNHIKFNVTKGDVASTCTINSFTASSYNVKAGDSVALSYDVSGCASLNFSTTPTTTIAAPSAPGGHGVTYVSPQVTTTYTLGAVANNGVTNASSKTLTVTVGDVAQDCVINSFIATPSAITTAGQSVGLGWSLSNNCNPNMVTNNLSNEVVNGHLTVNNSSGKVLTATVYPTATTTYTLTASSNTGPNVTKSVTVTVGTVVTSTSNLSVTKNPSINGVNASAGASNVRIGSYILTAPNQESVKITGVSLLLDTTQFTNFKIININDYALITSPKVVAGYNVFSTNLTLSPSSSTTLDVYADVLSSASQSSGSVLTTSFMGCSGTGVSSQNPVTCGMTSVTGQTITITSPTTPVVTSNTFGYLDTADCNNLVGWALDLSTNPNPVYITLYDTVDNLKNIISKVDTSVLRKDVNDAYGVKGNHGFSLAIPANMKDGKTHSISAYAYVYGGQEKQLLTSPKSLTCSNSLSSLGSLGLGASAYTSTLPLGCTSTSGYSLITGKSCKQ